jgi:hypothetical protein
VFYRAPSPDGSATLELVVFTRPPLFKGVAQWELSDSTGRVVIKTWEASDMAPCFAAAAWSPDSRAVIALFRNYWHGSELVAFDVKAKKIIDSSGMAGALGDRIRSEYVLPDVVSDPIAWARETEDATRAFTRARSH